MTEFHVNTFVKGPCHGIYPCNYMTICCPGQALGLHDGLNPCGSRHQRPSEAQFSLKQSCLVGHTWPVHRGCSLDTRCSTPPFAILLIRLMGVMLSGCIKVRFTYIVTPGSLSIVYLYKQATMLFNSDYKCSIFKNIVCREWIKVQGSRLTQVSCSHKSN